MMSKNLIGLYISLLFAIFAHSVFSQDLRMQIEVTSGELPTIATEGRFATSQRTVHFLDEYGDARELSKRIISISAAYNGRTVAITKTPRGKYEAATDINEWRAVFDATPPIKNSHAAHISWVGGSMGILMLDDIVPLVGSKRSAEIELSLPDSWKAVAGVRPASANRFVISDVERSAIIFGRGTITTEMSGKIYPRFAIFGEWRFAFEDVFSFSHQILDSYQQVFGSRLAADPSIVIAPFPHAASMAVWEADTRGSTVVILSGDMPFASQSRQFLHEQLRHEIFHLWMPNGVRLTGSYDWFYEGFALYQSLRVGVGLDRIRFSDKLDTLSRAMTFVEASGSRESLIDASRMRWSGANSDVYARGMLAAFACDLAMLKASGGRRNVETLLRSIYGNALARPGADANGLILDTMLGFAELRPVVEQYIRGAGPANLDALAIAAGMEVKRGRGGVILKAVDKPNGTQKALLEKLGYNRVFKMNGKSK
jgi:hypothetical protein